MTGPEHYAAAENMLKHISGDSAHHPENMLLIGGAQVHATLAAAAATALAQADGNGIVTPDEWAAWDKVAGFDPRDPS